MENILFLPSRGIENNQLISSNLETIQDNIINLTNIPEQTVTTNTKTLITPATVKSNRDHMARIITTINTNTTITIATIMAVVIMDSIMATTI